MQTDHSFAQQPQLLKPGDCATLRFGFACLQVKTRNQDLSSTASYGRIEKDDCAALELLRYSGPGLVVPARSR